MDKKNIKERGNKKEVLVAPLLKQISGVDSFVVARKLDQDYERFKSFYRTKEGSFKIGGILGTFLCYA